MLHKSIFFTYHFLVDGLLNKRDTSPIDRVAVGQETGLQGSGDAR